MSIALEIVTDAENNIDLDPWCDFARVEGRTLVGRMRFGPEVIGTDSPEIIEAKKQEAGDNCDRFLEIIESFLGQTVTVIYEATKVALVAIPDDFGLNATGDEIRWQLVALDDAPASKSPPTNDYQAPQWDSEFGRSVEKFVAVAQELEAAVRELTLAINGKRGK